MAPRLKTCLRIWSFRHPEVGASAEQRIGASPVLEWYELYSRDTFQDEHRTLHGVPVWPEFISL